MINSMYELGKFWINKDNLDQLSVILDADKFEHTRKVLYVNINMDDLSYDGIIEEDYKKEDDLHYLYKKGSSRGTNLSPSAFITDVDKTFDGKFIKWFKNHAKKDEFINNVYTILEENRNVILSNLGEYYGNISPENRRNVLLTIRFKDQNEFKYLDNMDEPYNIFRTLLLDKANEKYYSMTSPKIKSSGNAKCYLCDEKKEVHGLVPSSIGLTFGTVDKPGNTPELNRINQWKQSSICADCALYLEAGKKFVERFLSFSEFGLRFYVIPTVFFNNNEVLDELYDELVDLEDKRKYSEISDVEEELSDLVEDLNDILEFKFLYYEKNNNSFNILGYVESIIPSWLQKIYLSQKEVKSLTIFNEDHMKEIFGDKVTGDFIKLVSTNNKTYLSQYNWYLGFLRDFTSTRNSNKYYLEIVNSIMSNNTIDYDFLLEQIMSVIRKNWRNYDEEYGFMRYNVFKGLHLLILLDKLNLFKGGKKLSFEDKKGEDILTMLDTPEKRACLLIGILTKKLTRIQYKRLNSTPFVKKLWGLNLDNKKLKQAYKEVINKLTEYDSLYSYKKIEELISINLLESDKSWKLNKNETSYYFVLGFTIGDNFKLDDKGVDLNE
ncbi:TIGR02556 family CRISPR-associated protein [Methanosphaera sp. WGK6]|uniref:TIGR02556 family CRISPR-associated protein n=1 Tax=Methanosphaera sp. WGK6 TaxID=1561964 RepID=UPI00117C7BB8|nr:TIGR02556 family CRISPR-associated protein [Methanosphaera sp. WGK6]